MEPQTLIGRCPEGMEYVRGYRKKNGEYVKGFCRKRHERITRHGREVDRRNAAIARRSLQPEEPEEEPVSNKEVKEEEKELKKELKEESKEGSTESTIRAAEERAQ
jgi:hypothetical protein